jgi:hypothetical protein
MGKQIWRVPIEVQILQAFSILYGRTGDSLAIKKNIWELMASISLMEASMSVLTVPSTPIRTDQDLFLPRTISTYICSSLRITSRVAITVCGRLLFEKTETSSEEFQVVGRLQIFDIDN